MFTAHNPREFAHRRESQLIFPVLRRQGKYLVKETYRSLDLQGGLHGLKGRTPLHCGGLGDVLEDYLAPAHVLVVHELGPVLPLLLALLLRRLEL